MIVSMQMGESDEILHSRFIQLSIRVPKALFISCLTVLSKTFIFENIIVINALPRNSDFSVLFSHLGMTLFLNKRC